jgi:AcrR family transcriptional regulator
MPKVPKAHLEQRREQILDAAIACFARKGFHETTMADIAAQAGVSDTLAYRYFSGKDHIIEAAVRRHGDTTIHDLLGRTDGVENLHVLAEMLLETNIRRFDHPDEIRKTMGIYLRSWAEALQNEEVRREVVDHWRRHFDVAEGLIARAQRTGQASPALDAQAAAWVMLATHYGLNLLAILDPEIDLERCKDVALALTFGELTSLSAATAEPIPSPKAGG